jgi:hypothetical protein
MTVSFSCLGVFFVRTQRDPVGSSFRPAGPRGRSFLVAAALLAACPLAGRGADLFDGRTFAGWNGDTASVWRIEDGAIVAGHPDRPTPRNEFLASDRRFGDFELRVEYRVDCGADCNAGVQFRTVRIPDHHEVIGYQADIGPGFEGGLYDESRRRTMLVKPAADKVAAALAKARDGWNEYVIRCVGPRIQLAINGVETADYIEPDASIPREGVVALQIHAGMRGTVRYRNIRITEFPPLLASDFRLAPDAEGWQGSPPPDAFAGETVRLAGDPDEHGMRITSGILTSPAFPVDPFGFYRVRLLAKGTEGGHWAVSFLDAAGKEIVADVYDSIDPAPTWRQFELCFRGHADARTARVHLRRNYNPAAAAPLDVKNVRVEKITPAEAAAWAAGLAAQCPVVRFEPAADRWRHIPKSMAKLVAGDRLRIVMLGDSICNDTSNSLYETLLAERYPGARIEVVTSVRGGTGCTYYKDENRVQSYVLDYRPDLVIIAGISHDFDVEAMRSVVRQIRAGSGCEILVMSGAVAPWEVLEPAFIKVRPAGAAIDQIEQFDGALAAMCRAEQVEFFDVRRAWDDYLLRSPKPYEHFARDAIHANGRGKAVLGRILGRYFAPKQPTAAR